MAELGYGCNGCITFFENTKCLSESLLRAYSIGAELGRGRAGVVRECFDKMTGERLACKSILKSSLKSPQDVQGLRNEVAAMEKLAGHPHIVELRRVFEDPFSVHLVMEFCEGGDLFDELTRRGAAFTEAEAADVFLQIVSAVEHCHRSGILHRDIKPENVLVKQRLSGSSCCCCSSPSSSGTREGAAVPLAGLASPHNSSWCKSGQAQRCRCRAPRLEVKLADFGLATCVDGAGRAAGLAGSPFYVAPEVVLARTCTPAADMWSLGTLLYGLLSQDLPFLGSSHLADQMHHARASQVSPVPFSRAPWAAVSHAAKELILLLLHPDPVERPTASALLASNPWVANTCHGGTSTPAAAASAAAAPPPRLTPIRVAVDGRQRIPTPPSSPRTPGSFRGNVLRHKRHKPAPSGLGSSPRGPAHTAAAAAAAAEAHTDENAAMCSSPLGPDSPTCPTPRRPSAMSPHACSSPLGPDSPFYPTPRRPSAMSPHACSSPLGPDSPSCPTPRRPSAMSPHAYAHAQPPVSLWLDRHSSRSPAASPCHRAAATNFSNAPQHVPVLRTSCEPARCLQLRAHRDGSPKGLELGATGAGVGAGGVSRGGTSATFDSRLAELRRHWLAVPTSGPAPAPAPASPGQRAGRGCSSSRGAWEGAHGCCLSGSVSNELSELVAEISTRARHCQVASSRSTRSWGSHLEDSQSICRSSHLVGSSSSITV